MLLETIDFLIIVLFLTEINWTGFVLGCVACFGMISQAPIFKKYAPSKYVVMLMITLTAWTIIVGSLLFCQRIEEFTKSIQFEDRDVASVGLLVSYAKVPWLFNMLVIDLASNKNNSNLRLVLTFAIALMGGFSCYKIRLSELGKEYYCEAIKELKPLKPDQRFDEALEDELRFGKSLYINYFLNKVCIIMGLNWRDSLYQGIKLKHRYLKDIPYLDNTALMKKYSLYSESKAYFNPKDHAKRNKANVFGVAFKFLKDTIRGFFNVNNFSTIILYFWVFLFASVRNQIPTVWTLIAIIGVGFQGVIQFNTFMKVAQIFILIPLYLNFLFYYLSNIENDPFNCNMAVAKRHYGPLCFKQLGFVYFLRDREKDDLFDGKSVRYNIMIVAMLFKILTFFFKIMGTSEEISYVKSEKEIEADIDRELAEGNISTAKIILVQIAGKFYTVCYIAIVFVATRDVTLTNMILLLSLLIYLSKRDLVYTHWYIFFYIVNFVVVGGFLLDLVLEFRSFQGLRQGGSKALIMYIGLPSFLKDFQNSDVGEGEYSFSSYNYLILYVFCLFQQLTAQNLYIQILIKKIAKITDKRSTIVKIRRKFKPLANLLDQIYYRGGIWIGYITNITLTMFFSITVSRFMLLVFQFCILLIHLDALRAAQKDPEKRINLKLVSKLWNYYYVAKIFVLLMLLTGTFVL